jgi:gas vesicle protein
MTHTNGHGFSAGLCLGAALGAIAALLLTPRSGREIRSGISRGAGRLKDRAQETAGEIRQRGESLVRRAREAGDSRGEMAEAGSSVAGT